MAVLRRAAFALAFTWIPVAPASALVWPDVSERIERDLGAADPPTRRAAARDLRSLGAARGAPLAIAALSDPDEGVQLAAADAAIRFRTAGAAEAVAGWLNAPDVRLRRKACEVARALPSTRVIAPLARTLGDPDADVRAQAAEALGRQASPDAVAPLLGRLDDPAPAVRVQVAQALSRLGDPRAVVPLVGKVEDSSPEVRQAVVRSLGDLADTRAAGALVLALRDQNSEVRRDAIAALGRMHADDAVDAIAPFMTDGAPSIRIAASTALGRIATPDAVRILVGAIGAADDAAGGLAETPLREALVAAPREAIPALTALLGASPSPEAATSAAWILGQLGARGAASAIVAAMRRGTLPTAAALHALAGAGTSAQLPVVLEFVSDRNEAVRDEALSAAFALLDPAFPDGRAVEPLTAALHDARPTVRPTVQERARIAALLGRTRARRAAPTLVEMTRATNVTLRLAAIDALGALGALPDGEVDVTRALLDALSARDADVRIHAAAALAEAAGPAARDALVASLDGDDEIDRAAALTALAGILARAPSDPAVTRLATALELTAGPERDAMIEAVGSAPGASSTRVLARLARSEEPMDRRAAAVMCAAHPGETGASALLRSLLTDPDESVRAQAAWSLGSMGDVVDLPALASMARASDGDAATNATAAIGLVASRASRGGAADLSAQELCPLLGDRRAFVRTNALAGLARSGGRCGDGSAERDAVAEDPNEDARAAAAVAIATNGGPRPEDRLALDRCARSDPSSAVAAQCRSAATQIAGVRVASPPRPTLIYIVPEGSEAPRPNSAYAVHFADGTLRVGIADRRGAVFEPHAPDGEVSLRRPSP